MNTNQKGFANLIVIGIVLAVVLGVGGYFVLVRKPATPSETQQLITLSGDIPVTPTPPPDTLNKTTPSPETNKFTLRLGENVRVKNGYGIKFTGLPFAECPSGLPKEAIAEVSGVELTLLGQDGLPLRDTLGNEKKIIICKGVSKILSELGGLDVTIVNFKYAEYPSGKSEIPATAEFILKS